MSLSNCSPSATSQGSKNKGQNPCPPLQDPALPDPCWISQPLSESLQNCPFSTVFLQHQALSPAGRVPFLHLTDLCFSFRSEFQCLLLQEGFLEPLCQGFSTQHPALLTPDQIMDSLEGEVVPYMVGCSSAALALDATSTPSPWQPKSL